MTGQSSNRFSYRLNLQQSKLAEVLEVTQKEHI
jgi:plasmid maintenance system antidote protein VapI